MSGCAGINCVNLPSFPTIPNMYDSYRCLIGFPLNCVLLNPQTFFVNASSLLTTWYSNGVTPVDIHNPISSLYDKAISLPYLGQGWIKLVGSDLIMSDYISGVPLANNIPFITDRFDPTFGASEYNEVTADMVDLGHSTMVDVFANGDVGRSSGRIIEYDAL